MEAQSRGVKNAGIVTELGFTFWLQPLTNSKQTYITLGTVLNLSYAQCFIYKMDITSTYELLSELNEVKNIKAWSIESI